MDVNLVYAHTQVSSKTFDGLTFNLADNPLPVLETSNIYKVSSQAFFAMSMGRAKLCLNCRTSPLPQWNRDEASIYRYFEARLHTPAGQPQNPSWYPLLIQLINPRAQICVINCFANENFSLMSSVRVSLVKAMSASFKR